MTVKKESKARYIIVHKNSRSNGYWQQCPTNGRYEEFESTEAAKKLIKPAMDIQYAVVPITEIGGFAATPMAWTPI
jgi:hypothetical protein